MNFIITKEQYEQVKANWKQSKFHSASDHLIYNVLRGFNPSRGFTPITSTNKLTNGAHPAHAFNNAKQYWTQIFTPPHIKSPNFYMSRPTKLVEDLLIHNTKLKKLSDKFGVEIDLEFADKLKDVIKGTL
jgi:hypothetical protein